MTAFDATACDECMAGPGVPCGPGCTALWGVLNGIEDASSADAVTRVRCVLHMASTEGRYDGTHVWFCRCGAQAEGFVDIRDARRAGDAHLDDYRSAP